MVTTTFVTPTDVESAIEVELPDSSASGTLTEQGELEVEITADDRLLLDGQPIDTAALRQAFEEAALENPSALVVIHADEGVDHGTVVTVMDTANQAGLGRLGIATEPLEEGSE